MIDFDVVTGPSPSEKPREPEPKPAEAPKRSRMPPRVSDADGGLVPSTNLDRTSDLQEKEDLDYVARLRGSLG